MAGDLKKALIIGLDVVQFGLDIAGLVPVIGEIADGLNALIYALHRDYVNAGLSLAAMIPFAGWAATGAKWGGKAMKLLEKVGGVAGLVQKVRHAAEVAARYGRKAMVLLEKKRVCRREGSRTPGKSGECGPGGVSEGK